MADIGWMTGTAEADTYFLTERLDSTHWDALTATSGGRDEKSAVLKQAYNRIRFYRGFSIPTSPDAAQLVKLKQAQCETAYYLAEHLEDEDRRKGIQAQGVVTAGVVKEDYAEGKLDALPFPAVVFQLLDEFVVVDAPFYAVDIDRDEDLGVNSDVVEEA